MPRFLKRIFPEHFFVRRETPDVSDLQRSRRVLVRPSQSHNALYEASWRAGVFYDGQGGDQGEERRALRDGASEVESASRRGNDEDEAVAGVVGGEQERKAERVRRRLSKRHRMPG